VLQDTLMGFGMKAQGATDAGRQFAGDEFGGVGPGKQGITAYHGSPHSFDRFSMDAIGTGEGAQAYGHGLYFAENEGVARGYRDALTQQNQSAAQRSLVSANGDVAAAIEDAKRKIALYTEKANEPDAPDLAHRLLQINKQKLADLESGVKPQGSMYEVNINANPDDFLDWDAPLSGQPNILERFGYDDAKYPEDWIPDVKMTGADLYRFHNGRTSDGARGGGNSAPSSIFAGASRPIRMKDGTIQDKAVNIPGIKYKDAGSRGLDGDGTRNFVVFDENLIEIVKKYGIAGAAAMLGVSAADVEDAMNGS